MRAWTSGALIDVIVVEREDQGPGEGRHALQHGIGQPDGREERGRPQQLLDRGHRLRVSAANGRHQVEQEGGQVVVLLVQREPGVGVAG